MFEDRVRGNHPDRSGAIPPVPPSVRPIVPDQSVDLLETVARELFNSFAELAQRSRGGCLRQRLKAIVARPSGGRLPGVTESGDERLDSTMELAIGLFETAARKALDDGAEDESSLLARLRARYQEQLDVVSTELDLRPIVLSEPSEIPPPHPTGRGGSPATLIPPSEVFELAISVVCWTLIEVFRDQTNTVNLEGVRENLCALCENLLSPTGPLFGPIPDPIPEQDRRATCRAAHAAFGVLLATVDTVARAGQVEARSFYVRFRTECQARVDRMTEALGFPGVDVPSPTSPRPFEL